MAPLPRRRLNNTLDEYPNAEQYFWVQEEPANQGAWPTFGLSLPELLPEKLPGIKRISRRAMSAPSSGSSKVHAVEQQEIIDDATADPARVQRIMLCTGKQYYDLVTGREERKRDDVAIVRIE